MPDRDAAERQSARQLTAMIWAGVGLVPIAVLIVLIGGGDRSLRFAVLLVAVSVVLVGASLLIRNDPELLRMDVADRIADETGTLRDELREEVAAAARATHHRVQALQDEVALLHRDRRSSGSVWPDHAAPDRLPGQAPGAVAAARGAVGAVVPAARGAVAGAAQVPRSSAGPRSAGPTGLPAGAERGREVAGPGQSVPIRGAGSVPVARAAAAVRPAGGGSAPVPVATPLDRPADSPSGTVVPGPGGRGTQTDDVRRPRRGERRGRRSADRDSEGVDAAPSAWLAEPDSGWLIRPEDAGNPIGSPPVAGPPGDAPPEETSWSYGRESSRWHRSADPYDPGAARPGADGSRHGSGPGRRRRRAADESW